MDILVTWGIPTAITGLFIWLLKKHIDKRDNERSKQDKAREQFELLLVRANIASITLGEATAKAVQRIPDAHCNGDMKDALKYAEQLKHEQRDFLAEQGVHHIN